MVQLEDVTNKRVTSLTVSEDKSQPSPGPSPAASQNATNPSAACPLRPSPPPPLLTPGPALPPQRAHNASKTVDEILADLNQSPLFMTELDDGPNADLEALHALAYEGTPLENAADFKQSGNAAFRERRWADAREFYSRGIALLAGEEERRKERRRDADDADDADEVEQQRAVLEALYVNRAAAQLALGNRRQCWLDGAAALARNARNAKAWYRSARALLAAGRVAEAGAACAGGLAAVAAAGAGGGGAAAAAASAAAGAPLLALQREVAARAEEERRRAAEAEARRAEAARRARRLRQALAARGVRVRRGGGLLPPPDTGDARMELVEEGEGGGGAGDGATLTFPAVLLYPAHYESDFIKAFSEKESLMQYFGYVFPLPWDKAGEYSANTVECFVETITGGLVKVGKKVALLKMLTLDSVELVDGLVKIFVIPKAKADGWVTEWKAAKAKEREAT